MGLDVKQVNGICPREEIFAYIDGELSSDDEVALDFHLTKCKVCANELNSQKKVSTTLEIMLEEEARKIELPEDFTKIVTANAESNVSGLRHSKERSHALLICTILFLLVTIVLGTEVGSIWVAAGKFAEQFAAVLGFVFHFVYDTGVGITVILRSLGHRFVFGSVISVVVAAAFFVFSSYSISRWVLRYNRT